MPVNKLTGAEAIRKAVGDEIGVSDWLQIDQARIDAFAEVTDDHQWIHVDIERAQNGPFGAPVAHGYLTLSLHAALSQQTYDFSGFAMKVNYGLDRVRFLSPVRVDSRVRLRAVLTSADDTPKGLRVTTMATIELEGSDVPACVAESITLLVP